MLAKRYTLFMLLFITLLGGYFRYVNINWDKGMGFHPDEMNIAFAVKEINFPHKFNPKFYAYGTVPIYTIRGITQGIEYVTGNRLWTSDTGYITYIGRLLSFAASTITIPILFFLACTIFSTEISLLAAFITATSPLLIQYAHFSVTESTITLYAVCMAYESILWYRKHRHRTILVCGIILGLSLATKISTVTYAIFPLVSFCIGYYANKQILQSIKKIVYSTIYLFLITFCVFVAVSPVTFIYPVETLESLSYERAIAIGNRAVFYTNQFIDTTKYIFQFNQLPRTIGYPMTIFALVGFIIVVNEMIRKRQATHVIMFLWLYIYLCIIGTWYAKFIRYVVPAYPFIILIGTYAFSKVLSIKRTNRIKYVLIISLVLIQFFQSIAFVSIYTHSQTRHQALSWIESESPVNAIFLTDDASEFLPETSFDMYPGQGRFVKQIPHFGLESVEEIYSLAQWLAISDYYVIGTRRQLGVAQNHPMQFPKTAYFYDQIFSGAIGYEKVAYFSSYPSLTFFGKTVQFPDDSAEETLQVFDHPTIMIFKNKHIYDSETILRKINNL